MNRNPGHRDQEVIKMLIVIITSLIYLCIYFSFIFYPSFVTPEHKIIIIIIIIIIMPVTVAARSKA